MALEDQSRPRQIVLGCIADDVTGATDLAINLVQGGMRVVQYFVIPTAAELAEVEADAVVIALKTRSIPSPEAISTSREALAALRQANAKRFFFKYCSTFDSTADGNIGPVASALLDALDIAQTILCPAFPRNGRTVYQGHLFVQDKLLHESGMERHPINPMTDANLVRWLRKQTTRDIGLLSYQDIISGRANQRLLELSEQGKSLVIADACDDSQLERLAQATSDLVLLTGGSGIARFLPDAYRASGLLKATFYVPELPHVTGRALILSGSCSAATNRQVAWMRSRCPSKQIDVGQIISDDAVALEELVSWAHDCDAELPVLVYSTAEPDHVTQLQAQFGGSRVARAIEQFLATAAAELVPKLKIDKLIVAGGETSGAVVQRLGVRSIRIGQEICAGVPWTESPHPTTNQASGLALALKSGNFGDDNFFEKALEMLR